MKLFNPKELTTGCFLVFLLLTKASVWGQKIEFNYENKPLNACLIELRDRYSLQIAFNDDGLSHYLVSAKGHFASPDKAFETLLKQLPVRFEKSGAVYMFYYEALPPAEPITYRLSGVVADARNRERLPYSHVQVNGVGLITDEKGNFAFSSKGDSTFKVQLSYLGYYRMDTVMVGGGHRQFLLRSSAFELMEVLVKESPVVLGLQVGAVPGGMRLNQVVARCLPGSGDNAVFNLLRLQPGVLASGEQASDMVIWGSYPGHSQVLFDGFTLFGLKNFNDNISAVNPYMAKDIRVLKGAYSAEFGERVGGIVDISGLDGNKQKPELNLNMNNMTLSTMASVPIGKRHSATVAYRQTYYNLYDETTFAPKSQNRKETVERITTQPDYDFKDLNVKFSGESADQKQSYHLSFYGGVDHFDYDVTSTLRNAEVANIQKELNKQWGASAFWAKQWKGGLSNLSLSYSGLVNEQDGKKEVIRKNNSESIVQGESSSSNTITELRLCNKNEYGLTPMHQLHFGWGVTQNNAILQKLEIDDNNTFRPNNNGRTQGRVIRPNRNDTIQDIHTNDKITVLDWYVEDQLTLTSFFNMNIGLRGNITPAISNKVFLQPRVAAELKIIPEFKVQGAVGYHNQFISQSSRVDGYGNTRYDWVVSDNEDQPVLGSEHFMVGANYTKGGFTANVEAYAKNTDGLIRSSRVRGKTERVEGDSKTRGVDFFLKQEYKGHTFWAAYTLSQTMEHFSNRKEGVYTRAQQDQRHELKLAGIVQLRPFYLSANYVYGSGFLQRFTGSETQEIPYSRLDISATYQYKVGKVRLETGLSVLNVLNTENIKMTNYLHLPTNNEGNPNDYVGIHAEAVPFTPTIFLNIAL